MMLIYIIMNILVNFFLVHTYKNFSFGTCIRVGFWCEGVYMPKCTGLHNTKLFSRKVITIYTPTSNI